MGGAWWRFQIPNFPQIPKISQQIWIETLQNFLKKWNFSNFFPGCFPPLPSPCLVNFFIWLSQLAFRGGRSCLGRASVNQVGRENRAYEKIIFWMQETNPWFHRSSSSDRARLPSEVWAVQKRVNLEDLVESFPTKNFLQILASIQKRRTSPLKFDHLAEKSE